MSSFNNLGLDLQACKELIDDNRWQLVLRIAASEEFHKCARLRDFLLFICKNALQEHPKEVHEHDIGCAVFGRRPGYNPGDDSIVRVQARELRKRLEQYFTGGGKEESLEIRIPKGSYVPYFEPRNGKVVDSVPLSRSQPSAMPEKLVSDGSKTLPPWPRTARRLVYSLLCVLLLAMALGFWQWTSNLKLQSDLVSMRGRGFASEWPLFSRLFDTKHETYIVAGDANWCLSQRLLGKEFSLDDYVSRGFVNTLNKPELSTISSAEYTGMAELRVFTGITHVISVYHTSYRVRFARNISIEDLKFNHFILVGSNCSNPWGELFGSMSNFHAEHESASHTDCFVNEKPLPGESARYCAQVAPGGLLQTYCLIKFVPNLSGTGNGLIIAGTSSEGTQAGGEFLIGAGADSKLRQYLKLGGQEANIPYFELLFKTSGVLNGPMRAEYVAHRIVTIRKN